MSEEVAVSRRQIGDEVPMVVSEITNETIYTGLFGSLDSARINAIIQKMVALSDLKQINVVIIDLGNVDALDSAVAKHLVRLADTLNMVGVKAIFCGIKGAIAASMVSSNIKLGDTITTRDLKSALKLSYKLSGYKLVKTDEF